MTARFTINVIRTRAGFNPPSTSIETPDLLSDVDAGSPFVTFQSLLSWIGSAGGV